ncbi:putative Ig domain-containing protein [Shinella kummerowiae]|uniref:putative Ig domain-containing protein n=1 Tax=Shinella kummerowiae TaxID=417745 RepID=UPI00136FC787
MNDTQTLNGSSCDIFITYAGDSFWGGLHDVAGENAIDYPGVGYSQIYPYPSADSTVTTTNATYKVRSNSAQSDASATDIFTVTLMSVNANAGATDTITLYTCPSYGGGSTCPATKSVAISVNLNVPLSVTGISPASGPASGGTVVTITGANLSEATGVTFGGVAASAYTIDSGTQITATAPAGTAGAVSVLVTAPVGRTAIGTGNQFTYIAAPTVTSVTPTAGPTGGGTSVTITGSGFSGATAVTFGGAAATGYTIISNTLITATAPAGSGTVDIRVTTAGGTSATTAADQYTYVSAPTVTSVSPTAGPTGGGTTVIITGTGFAYASGTGAVKFGATNATYTINSNTQITATSPANSAGTYDITVVTPGGTSATSAADQYTYVSAPTVTSVSTTAGPTAGGTTVTITGTGFASTTAVTFGATAATGFTVTSNTQITATAPAGSAGTVDIRVTTVGGTSATSAADQYTYVTAPTVTSVSPTAGPTAGGTTVTITGTGFSAAAGTGAVKFGATVASYTINSSTQITATSPVSSAGTYDITVTTVGGTSATSASDQYTYVASPVGSSFVHGSVTAYNDGSNTSVPVSLTGHVTNNPTSYAVGSATTAQGGSVTVDSSGVATYTPPLGFRGNDSFTFTGTNLGGTSAPATVIVPVGNPTLSVSLPSGTATVGRAYNSGSAVVTITGGRASYTINSISGLPAGLTDSGGVISGMPDVNGVFTVTVNITDSSLGTGPYSANATATLTVSLPPAPVVSSTAVNGLAYNTGSATATTFSLAALATESPTGFQVGASSYGATVSIDSAGLVSYTPPVGFRGTDVFNYVATNQGGTSNVGQVFVTVNDPVFLVTLPAATGTVGEVYNSGGVAVSISGGNAPYSNFSATGLPDGLSISTTGVISGTPTAAGNATVVITATDSSGGNGSYTSTASATLAIAVPTITISPVTLSNAGIGVSYGAAVTSTGGLAPVTFAVTAGSLPPGLALDPGGVISGTATGGGTYNFTITATDSATTSGPYTGARAYALTVDAATIVLSPAAGALPGGTTGIAYSQTITAADGTAPYSYAVAAGTLPAGLTLAANGTLSGTPTASGTFNFTVTGTDSSTGQGPYSNSNAYSVTIVTPTIALSPSAGALPVGAVGTAYSQTFTASNGTAPYSYAVTSGALPSGLTLSGAGEVSGTPDTEGPYSFDVTATDTYGATVMASYSLAIGVQAPIANAVTLTIAANASAQVVTLDITGGAATSVAVATAASHGTATASGTAIHYTPAAGYSGTDSFTYTATNAAGTSSPATVTVTVTAPTLALSPAAGALPDGTAGTAYSQTFTATNGTAPYSYAVTGGVLPSGLTLSAAGEVSGTPDTDGAYGFDVTATDTYGATGTASYSLTVGVQAPVANAVTLTVAANASAQAVTLDITGGAATSVAVATAASHGTATASGTAIHYTPAAGYSGTDSFTYTATNTAGTSSPATVTVTVTAPTLALSPAAGALPAGTVGASYSQTFTATNGTAPYSYAVTSGVLPGGLTLSGAGEVSGTPDTEGAYSFDVTATDTYGATGTASYSLVVGVQAPIANAVTLTVAANASAQVVTLDITGGAATSVAVATAATHGTATASGTAIHYTPAAGYSGTDTFTYTATNAAGTSPPATVTVTVTAPTLALSPAAGALPAGTVGTAYSQTFTATNGTSPYSYAVTSGALPAGLTLDGTTGKLDGTPTAAGSFDFTVTATDTYGATGTASYSLAMGGLAPIANAVTLTVAANASAKAVTLNITGGAATSVAVATDAAHGTATASKKTITYKPAVGYSGMDTFTYTATNAAGTSLPATVTVTVMPPKIVLSPSAGALPRGTVGKAYSRAITAANGTAPYSYAVTAGTLPAGLALDSAAGTIAGTPTAAGSFGFTITATDAYGATGSATYDIVVKAPVVVFAFTPPAGSLGKTMAGEAYSQQIKATGGAAPLLYSLASGKLPKGMVLNISTGELTGPLDAASKGSYTFTIAVRDNNGATGSASYSLEVTPRQVTAPDHVVNVPAGSTPADVYLNAGATGGPFTAAETTFVEPSNAGTAKIIRGKVAQVGPVSEPIGWYLQFSPNPAFSGAVKVGYRLESALGSSNVGTITYNLHHDVEQVAEDIDALVRGFVETRQSLIADGIYVPGLQERRQMEQATDTVTARMTPSEDGMTASFSTSLAQMDAARNRADGIEDTASSAFNVWIDGAFLAHKRDQNGGKWGSFALLNLGADYLLSDRALIGVSFHLDRMTDPSDADAELTGNGWLAGPYASLEIGKGVFWNTSLLYGGSSNDIDTAFWDGSFDTQRWMIDTAIEGEWQIGEATVLTPKLRAVYFNEKVDDYTVQNDDGDELTIDGFDAEQFRVSLGVEIARNFTLESGATVTPKLGVTAGYAGLDGSGLYGSLTAGVAMQTTDFWMLEASLLLNIEGDGQKSVGATVRAGKQF